MGEGESNMFKMVIQSDLDRVFPNRIPAEERRPIFTAISGETISFQAALLGDTESGSIQVRVSTTGTAARWAQVRWVGLVPSEYPCHPNPDEGYECTAPGIFPDPLLESTDGMGRCVAGQWRAVWIDIEVPEGTAPGRYSLKLLLHDNEGNLLCQKETELCLLHGTLPEQELIHTEWFHTDCLSDFYRVAPRSAQWWGIVEQFAECAVRRGINMLLTPVFTPPLDTAVGGERTTVQLVDVFEENGAYRFDFTDFERWVHMCQKIGVRYFEMPHLFTQWGAGFAPKIVVRKNGREEKRFGWHTPATGDMYRDFLEQFLPQLTGELQHLGIVENVIFHISDEPGIEHLEAYKAAASLVKPLLSGYRIMDALSSYELYGQDVVQSPIVATDHIAAFLQNNVSNLWAYYCTGQDKRVSNRFFGMPLYRCRILGIQLYRYQICGFLHWGFNFYNSGLSLRHINPFCVTDADCTLPSGDPFIVYPGPDGHPIESMRLMTMSRAIQDIRLLRHLESLESRQYVLDLMDEEFGQPVTFEKYTGDAKRLSTFFDRVRAEIDKRY